MWFEPTLQSEFNALGEDLRSMIETRYEMMRAEIGGSLARLRGATVLLLGAVILAVPSLILLGFCVALAIGLGFGAFRNQVGLVWGFLITGGGGLLLAAIAGKMGQARLSAADLTPWRTLRVLQRDEEILRQRGELYGDELSARRPA